MRRSPRIELAAASLAGVAALSGVTGSHAAAPGVPAIYVDYNADCTFTMYADGGIAMSSSSAPGPTLPPGTYQLLVWFPNPNQGYTCVSPVFSLSGPGVNDVSTFRGQELHDEQLATLQPSSTYTAVEQSAPDATRRVFTTAASGSNSVLLPARTTTTGPTKTSVQSDLVGSSVPPYRGTLVAAVSAAGAATLRRGSREVGSLEAGTYDVRVADSARRAGFFVERAKGKPIAVTGVSFVGMRSRKITLTAGSWTFFSDVGRPTRFTVVG